MSYHLPVNINASDNVLLENDYILLYHKSDGLNRRLMRSDVIISAEFKYQLKIESHEYQQSTGQRFSIILMGNIPIDIKEKLEFLISKKNNKRKPSECYGRYIMDSGKESICLIKNKKVFRSSINMYDIEEYEKAGSSYEIEFLKLSARLSSWIEEIYLSHL
jgi:hypothetical protein